MNDEKFTKLKKEYASLRCQKIRYVFLNVKRGGSGEDSAQRAATGHSLHGAMRLGIRRKSRRCPGPDTATIAQIN